MSTMGDPSGPGGHDDRDDDEVTRQYLEQVRSLHREWAELEERGDDSVQLSRGARSTLSDAVRADTRHGARVQMPPTDAGPYTLTELALRTIIRGAVDGTPGAMSLRTTVEYAPAQNGPAQSSSQYSPAQWGTRGTPRRASCRISATTTTSYLPELADSARDAVRAACARDLDLPDLVVDIHIEDLHEH